MTLKEKLKEYANKLRDAGIPVVVLQDPVTKKPSVTFSMLVVSFTMCVLALIGNMVDLVGGIDFDNSKDLLMITGTAYLGRQWQKLGEDKTEEKK